MPVPSPILTPHDKAKTFHKMSERHAHLGQGSRSWWLRERGYAQRVAAGAMCVLWALPVSDFINGQLTRGFVFGLVVLALQAPLLIAAHRNIRNSRIQFVLERMGVTQGDDA